MKALFLLFAALAWNHIATAQSTFEKYYVGSGSSATMYLGELASGNLFTGVAGTSIMDAQGNIIHTHSFDTNPFTNLQSVRKRTDNDIYFTGGYLFDSCAVSASLELDPVIGRMDSLGTIITMNRYQLNAVTCMNNALDLEVTSDGGAVAWGRAESFFALRIDPTGAPLWSRQFPHRGSFSFIRELPGGDLLAGFNMDTAGVAVARLDPSGNFLWCKSYLRPRGVVHDCVIDSDTSFIITGFTDSIASFNSLIPVPPNYHPKLFMMKLDGAGNVQWCKGYDATPKWCSREYAQIVKTLDENYVVLANVGIPNYNQPLRPFLMKTDLNGDTLWTRSVGMSGYTYLTVNLMASSDGAYYFDGVAYGDFGQASGAVFLFKTDSVGHLPCEERTQPVQVQDLFPTDSSFTLTSVDGAVAFPVTVSDLAVPTIVVQEGCTLTTVADTRRRSSPKIYPNPTPGRFTVQFADPLMAESYYSVYDTTGRLLYQRPWPQGKAAEEVDLSRFGSGTYVLKLTTPEGLCYERVVVE